MTEGGPLSGSALRATTVRDDCLVREQRVDDRGPAENVTVRISSLFMGRTLSLLVPQCHACGKLDVTPNHKVLE